MSKTICITEAYNQPVSNIDLYSFVMPCGDIYNITLDIEGGRINRNIKHGTIDVTPSSVKHINEKYSVSDVSQLGDIMSFPLFNPGGRYIADVNVAGVVNVIDLIEDKAFSILHSDDIASDCKILPVKAYEDRFLVTRTDNKTNVTYLEFIGWDGSALLEVKLPTINPALIDIDIENRMLYALDHETDIISRYDISAQLRSLPNELADLQ